MSMTASSRGNSVSDANQLPYPHLLDRASAAVTHTSPHTLIGSFEGDQSPTATTVVSLPFPYSSSHIITSPSNSSSSLAIDETRSQVSGYHPRDETDDYIQASDSDIDLRSPKRLRTEENNTDKKPIMRINSENGVGVGSTNGVTRANSNGDKIRQQELVRLMVQSLHNMGYSESAATLEKESGYPLESPTVAQFREGVLKGDWALVESLLPTLELDQTEDTVVVKFLIREQKYLELLEAQQKMKALVVLQHELTPLDYNLDRLHALPRHVLLDLSDRC
ncbi:10586_t:CDS:2 [Ambispora gerdemannii]|uniref:10586_t:CDS:1 n=1 Tax=Ambispora gerdemannii TaxID=144530 RepID=A0A9N9GFG6_9GLOM|nr:10586_t:CDS:2 [Ambispora gerdemannii]